MTRQGVFILLIYLLLFVCFLLIYSFFPFYFSYETAGLYVVYPVGGGYWEEGGRGVGLHAQILLMLFSSCTPDDKCNQWSDILLSCTS